MKSLSLITLLVILSACARTDSPLPLVGTLERDRIELTAEAREQILAIAVTEGEPVVTGQLLAKQDTALFEAQRAELLAAADRAAQYLAELVRGPRAERITQAKAQVAAARQHLSLKRKEYDRISRLRQDGLTSQSDLDHAYDARKVAQTDLESADAGLQELLDGTTVEQLMQARAQLKQAEAAIATIDITLSRLETRAPRDGIVESLPYEVGERPPVGAPLVVMLAGNAPYARVYIPESLRARVTPGLAAVVRVDGMTNSYAGTVRYVASEAAFTPYYALTQRDRTRLSFPAEITLTDTDAQQLPTGVPLEVDFPSLQ